MPRQNHAADTRWRLERSNVSADRLATGANAAGDLPGMSCSPHNDTLLRPQDRPETPASGQGLSLSGSAFRPATRGRPKRRRRRRLHPRAMPGCERRASTGSVLKCAAASLPDWPSSVRITDSGTLREGQSCILAAGYGRVEGERPFEDPQRETYPALRPDRHMKGAAGEPHPAVLGCAVWATLSE